MKTGWFVALAGTFYLFVVVLFWPFERQVVDPAGRDMSSGYSRADVAFSDRTVHVLIPLTPERQRQGLAGRKRLSDSEGMLWIYEPVERPSFWMKDMEVSIDIIWLRNGQVVEISRDLPLPNPDPIGRLPIYQPQTAVDAVLEVAAGFAARHDIKPGDPVVVER